MTWKPILGYENIYEISYCGDIWSIKSKKCLKPAISRNTGYMSVVLRTNGKSKTHFVHQLVCKTFHGPRPEGMVVSHLDNDKLNNSAKNLCWATYKENSDNSTHSCLGKPKKESTKEKLRKANIGKKLTEETKAKMSISQQIRYKENFSPMRGKKHSEETKRKISASMKKKRGKV